MLTKQKEVIPETGAHLECPDLYPGVKPPLDEIPDYLGGNLQTGDTNKTPALQT